MGWFKKQSPAPESLEERDAREWAEASARWRLLNAEARAAGCKCGRPATNVRRYGGTVGGVPFEVWSCEEHQNVNSWSKSHQGYAWVPMGDVTPETEV